MENKEFTLTDLNHHVWVVLRNGEHYFTIRDNFSIQLGYGLLVNDSLETYYYLRRYNNDCEFLDDYQTYKHPLDIMQVRVPIGEFSTQSFHDTKIVWEREENTLTQEEYAFLKMLGQNMYLYREKSNTLYMSVCYPRKINTTTWAWAYQSDKIELNSLWFEFIHAFDSEACCSYDLLKLKVKQEKEN